jgi:hypothetical protein
MNNILKSLPPYTINSILLISIAAFMINLILLIMVIIIHNKTKKIINSFFADINGILARNNRNVVASFESIDRWISVLNDRLKKYLVQFNLKESNKPTKKYFNPHNIKGRKKNDFKNAENKSP